MPFTLRVVTPERVVLEEPALSVTVMTESGEITVLPHHVPLVTSLSLGEMRVKNAAGEDWFLLVTEGFLEVRPGNEVVILADVVERAEELDADGIEARIAEMRKAAQELQSTHRQKDDFSRAAAAAALERELLRSRVARRRLHSSQRSTPGTET